MTRDTESLAKNQAALQQSLASVQTSLNSYNDAISKDTQRLEAIAAQQKSFAEKFENFVNGLPTKDDLKTINLDNTDFSRELNSIKAQMEELKKTIEAKASSAVTSSQLDGLTKIINEIRGKIEVNRSQNPRSPLRHLASSRARSKTACGRTNSNSTAPSRRLEVTRFGSSLCCSRPSYLWPSCGGRSTAMRVARSLCNTNSLKLGVNLGSRLL